MWPLMQKFMRSFSTLFIKKIVNLPFDSLWHHSGADTGFYLTTAKKKKKKKKGVTIIYAHNAYGVIFPVPDTYAAETFQALPFTEEL